MPLPADFKGFPQPQFTPTPNLIFDELLSELSESQLKVLLFLVRQTMGWRKPREDHSFVPASILEIQAGTGISKPSIIEALQWLEGRSLISRRKPRNETGQAAPSEYRLRFESDESGPIEDPKVKDPKVKNSNVGEIGVNLYLGGAPSFSVLKESKKKEEDPLTPFSEKPPEQPPLTAADLSLELSNLRRGTPAGRIKGKDLTVLDESLPKLLEEHGAEAVIEAYKTFLLDDYWKDRKFPSRGFTSQFHKYLPHNGNVSRPAPYPTAAAPSVPLSTPSFPERWNALVPERTIDPTLFTERPAAYYDPIFQSRFDEICGKFRSLIQRGADLDYLDLFRKNKDSVVPWWKMALMDKLGWTVPGAKGKGKKDDWLEEVRRENSERLAAFEQARREGNGADSGAGGSSAGVP